MNFSFYHPSHVSETLMWSSLTEPIFRVLWASDVEEGGFNDAAMMTSARALNLSGWAGISREPIIHFGII